MNSEEVKSTEQILLILNSLQNIVSESNAKVLDDILKDRYADISFMNILQDIMRSPHGAELSKEAMFKIKTSAAVMLNRCFVLQAESNVSLLSLEQSVQFYLFVLFSTDISTSIKRLLQPSFQALLKREEIQLADFFQEAFQKLVRLVQLHDSENGQLQNEAATFAHITFRKGTSYRVQFDPSRLKETYELIIMLANNFISLFVQKTAVYQQKILQTWKIFHSLIFRDQMIQVHPNIVQRTLVVWDNYIFDGIDLNKKLMPSYRFIYDWKQFSKDLIFILNYKALKLDQASNTYNYFFINQDCESTSLMQLKQKAVDIFSAFLNILQAVQNSLGIAYRSSFRQSFQQIQKSLLTSINYSAKHKNSAVEQTIYVNILNLFSIWVQLKKEQISEQLRLHFLLQVVIPQIQYELELYKEIFGPDDRGDELIIELNDCCQSQNQLTKLSIACKILQELVEESDQLYLFVKQYALQSIISSKIENYQLRVSFDLSKLKRLSNPTAFLMLSVTNYKEANQQEGPKFSILAQLINQNYFPLFQNYDKQYLYFFCGFAYQQIFQSNKQSLQYLMQIALSNLYGLNVKRFAFDFLINVCDNYYSQTFATQFLIGFFNTNFDSKWTIVCKMFKKYLERIDEGDLCRFVSATFDEVQAEAHIAIERKRVGQPIKCNDANLYLSTCRQISNYYDEISSKPALQIILLNCVQYLRQVYTLSLDDELIGISADIIEHTHILPDNFHQILKDVKQAYFSNEYRGRCYQNFFSACLEATNKTTLQQNYITQIQAIYDIIVDALGYLLYYPDRLSDDHYEDISFHLFLLQKLYMLYGDRLQNKYRLQTFQICNSLKTILAQEQQPLLLSRIMNMILLCKITIEQETKIYPIHEIYHVARSNRYLFAYDSSFLIYLLAQIYPVLSSEQRLRSVAIIIAVCDSWKRYSEDRNVRAKQKFLRQNAIMNYVLPSADLLDTPIEQMKICMLHLSQSDPQGFLTIKSSLTQNQIRRLSAWYGQTSNIQTINIQSLDYQEGSSGSHQSNEATLNDLNHNKLQDRSRRIIKVSRGFQRTSGRVADVPTPVKRHYKDESCIDEQQPVRSHGAKKRKIQSAIIHQISKREIVNEKIAKRSQRS